MRRDLWIAIVVCEAASASRAHAETRALIGVDGYIAAAPGGPTDAADIAWSAHIESRTPQRTAVIDWVQRESLVGGSPRRELHEAYVAARIDDVTLSIGRFRVPGGFWLMADGIAVAQQWTSTLEGSLFGGLRSFTNSRDETLLTSSPYPLPLLGGALTMRGDVQAAVSYTYTADRVTLYRGDGMVAASRQPEQFVDAEVATAIGETGFVTAGATMGSRYLVTYPSKATRIGGDPQLDNVWFGSHAVFTRLDWRLGEWRIGGGLATQRSKLGHIASSSALAAISGAFTDTTLRATWRRERAWRVDARYRARVWTVHQHAHRPEISLRWRHNTLDVQARLGIDVHRTRTTMPGFVDSQRLLYRLSVGRTTTSSELALGFAATAAVGDEASIDLDGASNRAPYTLEARSFGFVRTFVTHGAWFAGFDGELDVHGGGLRAFVQMGCSR